MLRNKFVHLIPYDAIGGVERAVRTMRLGLVEVGVEFKVETIFPPSAAVSRLVLWNPWFFFRTLVRLLHEQPDVLIVSLWRAYAVGLVVKLLRRNTRLIVFVHSARHAHRLDLFFTKIATYFSFQVWADARETLAQRLPNHPSGKSRVISFVTERIFPASEQVAVQPVFIFWGRVHPQKNLKRAVKLFAEVFVHMPWARFIVIGPDAGDLSGVQQLAVNLGLSGVVEFRGGMTFSEIQRVAKTSSFYLQTSDLEGMGMSVVEAMQLGLVPVVTPVGEICNYCRDGHNAILVRDDATAVRKVLDILGANDRFVNLRANAIATWVDKPLYKDDVLNACEEIQKMSDFLSADK